MELRLDGKVALVTGASRGIGKAIAAAYAEAGASVMLSSRKAEGLEKAAADMKGEVAWFAANAGEPEAAQACVDATIERFGGIDILVNNAAANPFMGALMKIEPSHMDKIHQVNQRALIIWTQCAWRAALKERGGSVINVSSIGGISSGASAIGYYDISKAAVIQMTKKLAAELAPKVRVNAIAPGLVKTDFARALWEPNEEGIAKVTPLRRLGEPEDIANGALFLASDAASWVTGTTMVIDGGALLGGGPSL
jgi:NAD(P)-dependent dehydrogenase (short-subunit alcohol dehydrogenase family)